LALEIEAHVDRALLHDRHAFDHHVETGGGEDQGQETHQYTSTAALGRTRGRIVRRGLSGMPAGRW